MENQKENRELIGVDRDGNKYYQYYSYFGLPTRREIRFKEKGNYSMKDLAYYDWLTARQPLVPTAEELKQLYNILDAFSVIVMKRKHSATNSPSNGMKNKPS